MSTTAAIPSARELLVTWANDQDGWVRAIVGEAIVSRRGLSEEAVEQATETFLVEKQLAEGEPVDVPLLGDAGGAEEAAEPLRLVSLRDCRGVYALAADQAVEFNAKMTILFGENATGKTGYVRVFKRVANVRSAEPIIPDVHRTTATGSPRAVLRYALGDTERELVWSGESGIAPLTRLSIFDSGAVALHLAEDLTYVYPRRARPVSLRAYSDRSCPRTAGD